MPVAEIKGYAAPGFDAVKDAFAGNFANGHELGARFSAVAEGETVVDLWAGWSDRAETLPWTEDTLAAVYSSGKAVIARLIAEAVSEGALDYERAVAEDWPAFAAEGKGAVTLAQALSHQAGLCGFADPIPPDDWIKRDVITARIAAMAPLWPPGTANGYHPQTVGFIANEVLRRRKGRSIGEILREQFLDGRGADIHCGMRPAEIARAAFMAKPPRAPDHRKSRFTEIAFLKPWSAAGVAREAWMAAEIPASNMHATAKALADIVHPLANRGIDGRGAAVIAPGAIAQALRLRIEGEDLVLPGRIGWTAGLMTNSNGYFGPSREAYGHAGFGGAAVMIDPRRRISAAYVMNKMSPHLAGDPRAVRLFSALY
ncbi:MAG: serine hydrolase domain-containing protein [Parvularculaceae bacterium]|nr:serine hydrolase domain-containing protein [Parvularculaceae bacterium]